ncbi:class I SAM-dependent methyltransferase [Streptomyces lucensis]|uniref:class I SAM-dependent methyltransferase n=1 Tax=Streptomyces lucensis TaxID=67319 RepID=UPI001E31568B|nr:methyltransferase domain-containing protein [Streptomyces lucensis]
MRTDHDQSLPGNTTAPGAGTDASRMPGHWLLARLGKRVLRPGGLELTRWMLDALAVGPDDRVVELAAGLGATAPLTLARTPAAYVAVDREPAAVARLGSLVAPGPTEIRAVRADAARTGLPDASATVVYGEAMLSMQPLPAKRRIVREARRLLDGSSGRYAIHELCLRPDDIPPALAERITADLHEALHMGARPLTATGWSGLLTEGGFTVTALRTAPMALLEPRRFIADEGPARAIGVAGRALRDPSARRRVMHLRAVFHRHRDHLGAISLLAVPTASAQ